jgi:hypothetical protein
MDKTVPNPIRIESDIRVGRVSKIYMIVHCNIFSYWEVNTCLLAKRCIQYRHFVQSVVIVKYRSKLGCLIYDKETVLLLPWRRETTVTALHILLNCSTEDGDSIFLRNDGLDLQVPRHYDPEQHRHHLKPYISWALSNKYAVLTATSRDHQQ